MKFKLSTLFVLVAICGIMLFVYRRFFRYAYCYDSGAGIQYVIGGSHVMMPGSGWSTKDGPLYGHPTRREDVDDEYFNSVEVHDSYQVENGNWIVLRQDSFGKKHGSDPMWTIWSNEFYQQVQKRRSLLNDQ